MQKIFFKLNAGVELIKSGKSELVIRAAEAILGPPAYIGFSAMGAMATDERMTNHSNYLVKEMIWITQNFVGHLATTWAVFVVNLRASLFL